MIDGGCHHHCRRPHNPLPTIPQTNHRPYASTRVWLAALLLTLLLPASLAGSAAAAAAPVVAAAPTTGPDLSRAWQRYTKSTGTPWAGAVPTAVASLDRVCKCSVFAYASSPCQSAATEHCAVRGGPSRDAFCSGILLGGGLTVLDEDPVQAAEVASYLQQRCFAADELPQQPGAYCSCFKASGDAVGLCIWALRRYCNSQGLSKLVLAHPC